MLLGLTLRRDPDHIQAQEGELKVRAANVGEGVWAMITCNEGKNSPCLMKLTHYVRYYQQRYGIQLSREMAEKEAAREGIVLDLSGACEAKARKQAA